MAAGRVAVSNGQVNRDEISAWHHSLDLTMGTLAADRAEQIANRYCFGYFNHGILHMPWTVRVYLVNGTLAAECSIISTEG